MRHVSDDERRARLAVRHALAPAYRTDSPEAATRVMTALHASEAATVYLSCWARVDALALADVDRALYAQRTLVRQLAMRRTLFVFPRDLLAAVWPSASARVARTERARMAKDVVAVGLTDDGEGWVDQARAEVLAALDGVPEGRLAAELRAAVPMIDVTVSTGPSSRWSASRVMTLLGAGAEITRAANTAHWRALRPRWTLTGHWLGDLPSRLSAADGYRELVRRWLHSFGPGTEADLVWWLGATRSVVRTALAELAAVEVTLDHGAAGWLLPDDLDEVGDPGPWVALLPVLDGTVMGWRGRDFYLGPHREPLFDRSGNAGTTAWVDGRVVGCWVQDDAGVVQVRLLQRVGARARHALHEEAARLTAWLGGVRITTGVPSPAMKASTASPSCSGAVRRPRARPGR